MTTPTYRAVMRLGASLVSASLLAGFFLNSRFTAVVKAGSFDPGQLVADTTFTAKDSMAVADIQAFLSSKGSVLAALPASQLGEGANGRSAAQIIYDAAHVSRTDFDTSEFGPGNPLVMTLNPQAILVTLQKEQGLITGVYDPASDSTAAALKTAMGMGCPDTSGCLSVYAGFTNQVTYGAAQLMKNYYKASSSSFVPGQTYTIFNTTGPPYNAPASQQVTIANASTSSLYQYTPHVYNGNYNFWYYMNLWFSPVAYKPVLSLDPADGSVYVIDDNGRWPVSGSGFSHWNFSWSDVKTITTQQLALPVKGSFTQLAKGDDGTVYYIENGLKRVITSARVFNRWNFSWSDVGWVSQAILDRVPYGLPAYELVMSTTGDGTIYSATNSLLYPIPADVFYNGASYSMSEVGKVPGYALASLNYGPLLSRLVLPIEGDGTVFFLDHGYGYRLSGAVASAWGFDLSTIRKVGHSVTDELGNGGLLTVLAVQSGGDGTVFLIQNHAKRPIGRAAWVANGYQGSDVRTLSASLLNTLPTGPAL